MVYDSLSEIKKNITNTIIYYPRIDYESSNILANVGVFTSTISIL